MTVQRLRRRYRELVREEIAHTVTSEDEIDEEMRHLYLAWTKVQVRTNAPPAAMEFTDIHATNQPARFYRVVVP